MKVIDIEYPTSLKKCHQYNDNIDVFVTLENKQTYCITITTLAWIKDYMKQTHKRYWEPASFDLIVEELSCFIIEEAIQEYAKDDAYCLKILSLSTGDEILK